MKLPGNAWTSLAAGYYHAAGEQSCHAVWAWGDNSNGQIGTGKGYIDANIYQFPELVIGPGPGLIRFTPASAAVGATVVATGTGLSGLTALSVNGTDALASVTNNSDNSFTFVVPAGATATGTTSVDAGCGSASSTAFTVLPCLTPNLQSPTLTLAGSGQGTVGAGAFDAGSTASCGAITFEVQKLRTGTVYGTMAEPGLLSLTAPAGAVFTSVDFASFGNPTGSEGNYTLGSCNAPNSLSRVQEALLNRGGTVNISASSGFFNGDPCNGTSKQLAVRATYTYPVGSASSSLEYACADLGSQPVQLTLTDAQGVSMTRPVSVTVLSPPTATITGLNPVSATPGTTVMASGSNLTGATALTVNGASAAISNLTATGFTFIVPAQAASSGNLILSLPCTQLLTQPFSTTPLPVELVQFTATLAGPEAVRLTWMTASEKNSAYFEVEASADGHTYRRVGQVAGHGNTTHQQEYQLVDKGIRQYATGLVYYRLRQVDQDGTATLSPVRTVKVAPTRELALFPNPTTGSATLTGVQPGALVTVLDAVGRPVFTLHASAAGTAALVLPPGIAWGLYVVRVGPQALPLIVSQ
ncbi:IPT/TIG domain-containing protein [Hymenobacter sp. DG25B]|uniref:IPT/TIG domain-containing protein n=1 Tax=Hymenobacter sp. DG25B TaxID=1385664 RepID=UPI0006622A4E|nr:IPT/TIG domain-containing protein [Hymenobacter sp. DG25B]